ncbi:MAG: 50S ribosomal protein L23 [Wenzhouxiangella sp.]|nr:50S ribosomal protein L23 [Wenzhouxiangella sp.]MCH8479480.1 50S ribosomal protein L23 [Wenzhouxiangella sp.]TVR94973.1 MAG: 50S ribosomal protein L23 [Wenzhouxiangellaceae bacterium]
MSNERMYQIIRFPHVSEKTARLQAGSNQYVFEVRTDATKPEIKQAVEGLFEVEVESVQVVNLKGKRKSFRFRPGKQNDWKKAYVRIKAGQSIEELQAD